MRCVLVPAGGSVAAYLEKCSADLLDLTELVRGRLSGQERLTLGALITIDVHARDVVAELAEANIKNVSGLGRSCCCCCWHAPQPHTLRACAAPLLCTDE